MISHTIQKSIVASLIIGLIALTPACNASKSAQGSVIGAATGAAAGAAVGHAKGNTALGAIIGAAVGGTAGALIGRRMDKQAEELQQDLEGAEITRVGEGIRITFDSGLMFATDQHALNAQTKSNLDKLAETLLKYDDTDILIEGHTDSDGSEEYNQTLSVKRAKSVSDHLKADGVDASRITTEGYGELQPIADNGTAQGKQMNRRVEVAIYANEEMKRAARNGTLEVDE
ncbi:MAG: OmpA family protein [Flavobacteriales bacterium]|nr:OmpA family protein [Flavobacteriales bacterium]